MNIVAAYTAEVVLCVIGFAVFSRRTKAEVLERVRVAIQGEPGSNSHLAVLRLLGEQTLVPCSLSAEVFERLSNGEADAAVLPIENSLHGAVADHYDLLLRHPVTITAELPLRIHHALIAPPGTDLKQITEVLSHPVALSQCRRFFLEHPHLHAIPAYDTAGSVKRVMEQGKGDQAAIAAPYAAEVYGGTILARDLEDDPQNFTRFLLLYSNASRPEATIAPAETMKMSVAFAIPHRPGSLVETLTLLAEHGANLTRIESRPVPGRPWEYVFFVDLRLEHSSDADSLMAVLRGQCSMLRELGRYAARADTALDSGGGV